MPDNTTPRLEEKDNINEWFRSSDDRRQGVIVNAQGDARKVSYAAIDGLAILEGDIELGTVEEAEEFRKKIAQGVSATQAIAIRGEKYRWPEGRVPYTISPDLPNKHRVELAIAHWQEKTPLRFVPRTTEDDYIVFQLGTGCSSAVGRQGGVQRIRLASGCLLGSVIHEIGHAIGLWHEQSRADRDNFVEIKWENIEEEKQFNFRQEVNNGFDIAGYDYDSIMHYPRQAFSKNGEDTIIPRNNVPIGQRVGLSPKDIAGVKAIYPNLNWPP